MISSNAGITKSPLLDFLYYRQTGFFPRRVRLAMEPFPEKVVYFLISNIGVYLSR